MVNQLLKDIQRDYISLVPSEFDTLLIFIIDYKVKQEELPERFTQKDISEIIQEVHKTYFSQDSTPQTERTIKNLIPYFLERPPDHRYETYTLTEYAQNYIQLLQNKLKNEYSGFPLEDSFITYFKLEAANIKDINQFKSWFKQGFDATSRRVIGEHLEALKEEVDIHIATLNKILRHETPNAMEMVHNFTDTFSILGTKASDLTNTLQLKQSTLQEITKVLDNFYQKIADAKHAETEVEVQEQEEREKNWQEAKSMEQQVLSFFGKVDLRLESIRARILFASRKLNELQENFQYQSRFKLTLRKLLELTLNESRHKSIKEGLQLPPAFPTKLIIEEKTQLPFVPNYDFNLPVPNFSLVRAIDDAYYAEKENEFLNELRQQDQIDKWVKTLKQKLDVEYYLDFSEYFYKILAAENGNIEIPLQVGFELFQFASNIQSGYAIEIEQKIANTEPTNTIYLWRMKIRKEAR